MNKLTKKTPMEVLLVLSTIVYNLPILMLTGVRKIPELQLKLTL